MLQFLVEACSVFVGALCAITAANALEGLRWKRRLAKLDQPARLKTPDMPLLSHRLDSAR